MKYRVTAILSGLIITLLAGTALACGESLFRVGKSVAFRQYTAPLPGSIIAVANTEAELMMVEQLVAAGHDVHIVAEPGDIAHEMQEHSFDIVLAYFHQREIVAAQTKLATIAYIPVAMNGTDEEGLARQMFDRSLSSDDSVKKFLKTIHRTLKSRS